VLKLIGAPGEIRSGWPPPPTNWREAAPFQPSYSIQLSYGRVEGGL